MVFNMKVLIISLKEEISFFNQIGFDYYVVRNNTKFINYLNENIKNYKLIIYDYLLKDIVKDYKEKYQDIIFLELCFDKESSNKSKKDFNNLIKEKLGINI